MKSKKELLNSFLNELYIYFENANPENTKENILNFCKLYQKNNDNIIIEFDATSVTLTIYYYNYGGLDDLETTITMSSLIKKVREYRIENIKNSFQMQ